LRPSDGKGGPTALFQKYGSGVNNIAVKEATARNIPVGFVLGGIPLGGRIRADMALPSKQTVRGINALVRGAVAQDGAARRKL
jgi:hypothetical protein